MKIISERIFLHFNVSNLKEKVKTIALWFLTNKKHINMLYVYIPICAVDTLIRKIKNLQKRGKGITIALIIPHGVDSL